MIDKDEYIKSLENLLIFMCKTYDGIEDELTKLSQEGNTALFKVPLVQGTVNKINIHHLGKMECKKHLYSFKEIKNEILRKESEIKK